MTSNDLKYYPVQFIAETGKNVKIYLQYCLPNLWMDWSTMGFVQSPAVPTLALAEMAVPPIPGKIQRYAFKLNAAAYEDGWYAIYYANADGSLIEFGPEYFVVKNGKVNVMQPSPIQITTGLCI